MSKRTPPARPYRRSFRISAHPMIDGVRWHYETAVTATDGCVIAKSFIAWGGHVEVVYCTDDNSPWYSAAFVPHGNVVTDIERWESLADRYLLGEQL